VCVTVYERGVGDGVWRGRMGWGAYLVHAAGVCPVLREEPHDRVVATSSSKVQRSVQILRAAGVSWLPPCDVPQQQASIVPSPSHSRKPRLTPACRQLPVVPGCMQGARVSVPAAPHV
jgi:hypothetical protein